MVIDGRKLAREREEILKGKVQEFVRTYQHKPKLIAIELSDDEGSRLYLRLKKSAAERVGIEFFVFKRTVPSALKGLSFQSSDGIFIQHPLGFDKEKWRRLVDQIPPGKDVDCLTTTNLQLIKDRRPRFLPATVKAIGYCLISALNLKRSDLATWRGQTLRRKRIVIAGRSPIIGLPLSYWLKSLGGDVTLLHSQTPRDELRATCQCADVLVSTVGKPGLVTGDMVKDGAIVIDAGSPKGDVIFDEVAVKAAAITPVPGGVGPLTVVSLMENVLRAADQRS